MWCSPCEQIRIYHIKKKLKEFLKANPVPYRWLFIFSTRNRNTIGAAYTSLLGCWKAFIDQSRAKGREWAKAVDYIGTYEITHSLSKGFNVHFHVVVGTIVKLNWKAIHEDWNRACGEPSHFNVAQSKPIKSNLAIVNYVAKYLLKAFWGGLSPEQMFYNRTFLKGKNRIKRSRGSNKWIPEGPAHTYCCASRHRNECNHPHISVNPEVLLDPS